MNIIAKVCIFSNIFKSTVKLFSGFPTEQGTSRAADRASERTFFIVASRYPGCYGIAEWLLRRCRWIAANTDAYIWKFTWYQGEQRYDHAVQIRKDIMSLHDSASFGPTIQRKHSHITHSEDLSNEEKNPFHGPRLHTPCLGWAAQIWRNIDIDFLYSSQRMITIHDGVITRKLLALPALPVYQLPRWPGSCCSCWW